MAQTERSQALFRELKESCVPLLGNSLLTPGNAPLVLRLLSEIYTTLRTAKAAGEVLARSLVSYVFFPLSSVLRRNPMSSIPDQVLEKTFQILAILCEDWWWELDERTWEQVFMLCSAIVGDLEGPKTGKPRDAESKAAAVDCLWSLLRERKQEEDPSGSLYTFRASGQLSKFRNRVQSRTFIPVLGQTVNSLLAVSAAPHAPLQNSALMVLQILLKDYLPDGFVPSILPGVVSSMTKLALNIDGTKAWAKGDIVANALAIMQEAILRSVGDDICLREGTIKPVHDLGDLAATTTTSDDSAQPLAEPPPFMTARTLVWLRGTTSQLHIALNSLTTLVNHPTPAALAALASLSSAVLSGTAQTLPTSQPLLLSFLVTLSTSEYQSVSEAADSSVRGLITAPSNARYALLQVLSQLSRDNLTILPSLIRSHADSKVEHIARLLEGVCRLAAPSANLQRPGVPSIAAAWGKLLGASGGIERWGWGLLSVLQLGSAQLPTARETAMLMLESDQDGSQSVPFPELQLKDVASREARVALESMFRSLGKAGGDGCLFAVEWFISIGERGRSQRASAALWCACRLLEGASSFLQEPEAPAGHAINKSRRLEKAARTIARRIADIWMDEGEEDLPTGARSAPPETEDSITAVEHVKGLDTIRLIPSSQSSSATRLSDALITPDVHRCLSLQLLSICARILEARFAPLLLHTIYPVLHAMVSPSSLVSLSGLAALYSITQSCSYASPSNLLLSNFDYALDSVSRRLTRRWLDVDATKVLLVLVRQVGRDVVNKAGDVVEECFDRLDEFHGYEVLVDGLVEVLGEVVKIIEDDNHNHLPEQSRTRLALGKQVDRSVSSFLEWYAQRRSSFESEEAAEDIRDANYPREAWGTTAETESDNIRPGDESMDDPPPTLPQALTTQIVSRSMYFLTHTSPVIRARILHLLASAIPVLRESALMPSIHKAWPFILNRLSDAEPFVVAAAAALVESLARHMGDFMFSRVWDDVWLRFRLMLKKLEAADATNALARKGRGAVGTESAYTYSHRLYASILSTMVAATKGVEPQDSAIWEVMLLCRRFLHTQAHEELQSLARELYKRLSVNNADAVWLLLSASEGRLRGLEFLVEEKWDLGMNTVAIIGGY